MKGSTPLLGSRVFCFWGLRSGSGRGRGGVLGIFSGFLSEKIFHCMELERVPMRDEKADGLADIATK